MRTDTPMGLRIDGSHTKMITSVYELRLRLGLNINLSNFIPYFVISSRNKTDNSKITQWKRK